MEEDTRPVGPRSNDGAVAAGDRAVADPTQTCETAPPLLRIHGLTKTYPGTRALDGAELTLRAGEVHGLAGLNGAGKSTVIKILSGVERPSSGMIELGGRPVEIDGAGAAQRLGIAVVHQEVPLLPNLSAAENMIVGREGRGLLRRTRLREAQQTYRDVARRLAGAPSPDVRLADLGLYAWQIVAIIRAVAMNARLLILDEPTSSLSTDERRALHGLLRDLVADGIGVLYVSHFLDDMLEAASRVTVLRDGRVSYSGRAASLTKEQLLNHMTAGTVSPTGRAWRTDAGPATAATDGAASTGLKVTGLSTAAVHGIDFEVVPGERLGLFGLEGCGAREALESIFGMRPRRGEVTLDGQPVGDDTRSAIGAGLALVTGDRGRSAIPAWSVALNHGLPGLSQRSLLSPVRRTQMTVAANESVRQLEIKAAAKQPMGALSGGNQQKALIGRWLNHGCRCLLLEQPTRGVDLSGRAEIHRQVRALVQRGAAVVIYSTDPEEIVEVCDRALIIASGLIVAEVRSADLTPARLEHLTRDRSLHSKAA